jgi:hypothetical protein
MTGESDGSPSNASLDVRRANMKRVVIAALLLAAAPAYANTNDETVFKEYIATCVAQVKNSGDRINAFYNGRAANGSLNISTLGSNEGFFKFKKCMAERGEFLGETD